MLKSSKVCPECGENKPLSEYYKSIKRSDGVRAYCKVCSRKQSQKWKEDNVERVLKVNAKYREDNRERERERGNQYRKNNPEKAKKQSMAGHLKANYNMTIEEYEKLLLKQNGTCAICNQKNKFFKRRLAVDHCHTTGKNRGLLCDPCNVSLGNVNEDIFILENMIEYIYKHLDTHQEEKQVQDVVD